MRRGEIRAVDFEPSRGEEANKLRPAIVVSNEAANRAAATLGRGVVTVVPLTSNIGHVPRFQVLIPAEGTGLHVDSKAQTEQIRAVSIDRLGKVIGVLPTHLVRALDEALRTQLAL